jgi:hypothetical protein
MVNPDSHVTIHGRRALTASSLEGTDALTGFRDLRPNSRRGHHGPGIRQAFCKTIDCYVMVANL